MSDNRGKQFEQKMKLDFLKTVSDSTIDRLYDQVSGYKSISNISDFIGYSYPTIFYLECKTHKGASIPFENITQYEKLKHKVGIHGVRAGVIIWFYEKDVVVYVPIATITAMKKDGLKSFGIRHLTDTNYKSIIIPSEKKRVFMDSDYSILKTLEDGD